MVKFGKGLVASALAFGMILGVGGSTGSTGLIGSGDVSAASQKLDEETYQIDLGKTKVVEGSPIFKPVRVVARGIATKKGELDYSRISIFTTSGMFMPTLYEVSYYKKNSKGEFDYYGKAKGDARLGNAVLNRGAASGTYHLIVKAYKYEKVSKDDPKKKYKLISTSMTKDFYHSDKGK